MNINKEKIGHKKRDCITQPNLYFQFVILIFIFSFCSCSTSYKYSYELENEPIFKGSYIENLSAKHVGQSFKVVTFNIEFAQNIEGAQEMLMSRPLKDFDVLLLQEMDESGVISIAEAMKLSYIYYPAINHPKHKKNVGNAILSKWPISKSEKFITGFSSSFPVLFEGTNYKFNKTATVAEILLNGQLVSFVTTHAPAVNTSATKKDFANSIASFAQELGQYVVVTGDFNTFGTYEAKQTANSFRDHGFDWASHHVGSTVSSVKSVLSVLPKTAFQLDHIFIKGFDLKYISTVQQNGVSDHLPIVAEIIFRD